MRRLSWGRNTTHSDNTINGISSNIMGMPTLSQPAKSIFSALAVMALGGEPTKVPSPPMLDEYAMPSRMNAMVLRSFLTSICPMMPKAKGRIMAAVAVLLIHIDKAAVTTNNMMEAMPRCAPVSDMIQKAILRSSFCTCKAVAKAKPPKNRKMMGSAKVDSDLVVVISGKPITAAATGTISAVMVTWIASVSHRMATKASKAKPLRAGSSNGRKAYNAQLMANAPATTTQAILLPVSGPRISSLGCCSCASSTTSAD